MPEQAQCCPRCELTRGVGWSVALLAPQPGVHWLLVPGDQVDRDSARQPCALEGLWPPE